jgi:LEA14-like dessication related protein
MTRLSRGTIAAMSILALASCATVRQAVQRPKLRFDHAQLSAISLGGVTLDAVFEVQNPNAITLSVKEVEAALFVEGRRIVVTNPPRGIRLPARSSTKVTLPLQIAFLDVANSIAAFLNKDQAKYRLEGNFGIDTPIGIFRLPMATEGTFDVPKPPSLALRAPSVHDLSLRGATIDLPIVITNPNRLPLPIEGLGGALRIDGAPVGSFSLARVGAVRPGAPKEITVPVTLRFDRAVAAADALRRGRARIELSAEIASGPAEVPMTVAEVLPIRR